MQIAALLASCSADRTDSLDTSSEPGPAKSTEQMEVLLDSPKFGQLMLMLLAVQAQLLLQEHFPMPAQGSTCGSSSSTNAA
jgi:hypothetical protein